MQLRVSLRPLLATIAFLLYLPPSVSFFAFPLALGTLPDPSALSLIQAFSANGALVEHSPSRLASALPSTGLSLQAVPSQLGAFRLASAFSPVPPKLVQKVQALQFVEMKELLPDNIGLIRRLEAWESPNHPGTSWRPRMREVNSLLSWVSCFVLYIAILSESHPELVKSRLAYLALMIAEARRNGGDGWLTYDAIFRQNAAEDASVDWGKLDSSLHTATFAAQSTGPGSICPYCSTCDHPPGMCALRPFAKAGGEQSNSPRGSRYQSRSERVPSRSEALPTAFPICIKWNKGECSFANCSYRHSCATCPGAHKARDCPKTAPGSFYKRHLSRSS